jgi:hypothetical protein
MITGEYWAFDSQPDARSFSVILLCAATTTVNARLDGVTLMPCKTRQDGHAIVRTIGSDASGQWSG